MSFSVNQDVLYQACERKGIQYDHQSLAERMDVDRSTVHRVLSGKAEPGARFLAGVAKVFGKRQFFHIIEVSS